MLVVLCIRFDRSGNNNLVLDKVNRIDLGRKKNQNENIKLRLRSKENNPCLKLYNISDIP